MKPPRLHQANNDQAVWPSLPLEEWRATHDTLHMWMQMVGKTRLALAPRQNHWWHVPLYLTSRGLTTTPMPYGLRMLQIEFDFVDHRLVLETSGGTRRDTPLRPQAVADFYREYQGLRTHASYEPAHAHRFFQMLLHADRILKRFACRFLGKSSPVHFFWGAFDLALTRFSGRRAPERNEPSGGSSGRRTPMRKSVSGFGPAVV